MTNGVTMHLMFTRAFHRYPRLRRGIITMLALLIIFILGWFLFAWFAQRPLLFPKWAIASAANTSAPAQAQVIWLEPNGKAAGVKVEAWLFTGEGVTADKPGPLLFYAHGNAEIIDYWDDEVKHYTAKGISVLLVEYRGYGRSTGSPSQTDIVNDYTALYDQMIARPQVDAARIIYHGRSLGGGILGALAAKRPPAAMILESTFTNIAPLAWRYALPSFMVRDPMNTRQTLLNYKNPVLIIHGQRDEVIPVAHAYRNHEACPQSQLIIEPDMSHNSQPPNVEVYWQHIFTFLKNAKMLDIAPARP